MHDEILNAAGDKLRLFSVWCARRVQHLITDERSLRALNVAERYANGEATREELYNAYKEAKKVDKSHYADNAARFAALPYSLHAAYFAFESAEWAVASEYADRSSQPKEWEAKRKEEWNIHMATINRSIGRELRLFAIKCARRVQYLIKNKESMYVIDVAERFANDEVTREELTEAHSKAVAVAGTLCGYHQLPEADSAAMLTANKSSLNAAVFSSGCAARARAFEVDGYHQPKGMSPEWMAAYNKEVAEQMAMLKDILEGDRK